MGGNTGGNRCLDSRCSGETYGVSRRLDAERRIEKVGGGQALWLEV